MLGGAYRSAGENAKALDAYEKSLAIRQRVHDVAGQASALTGIGVIHVKTGDLQKAIEIFSQALPLWQSAGDRAGEALILTNLAATYFDIDNRKALEYAERGLQLHRAIADRTGESRALISVGILHSILGDKQLALENFQQALTLKREFGDRVGQAQVLSNIGVVYGDLGETQKAIDFYSQALPLWRAVGDSAGEAQTLQNIGLVYHTIGEPQKAIDYYNQALPLERSAGARDTECTTLRNVGDVYMQLGDMEKARQYFTQSLDLARALGNRWNEAGVISSIGTSYSSQGDFQKALGYHQQALTIFRALGDPNDEARSLNDLGEIYYGLNDKRKALEYFTQALDLKRKSGDLSSVASTLSNIGAVYKDLGENQKALAMYAEALQLARGASDFPQEASTLVNLMEYWNALGNPSYGILFGKQAVNAYQDLRRNIGSLGPDLQRTYLATVSKHYRELAELLIARGRLAEAEQVLGLLKEQEYFNYIRRDAAEASTVSGRANLTPEEAEAEKRYREIEDRLVAIGTERGDLIAKKSLTADEKQRLDALEIQIAAGNAAFEKFLADLSRSFAAKPAMALHVEQLRETQGIMEDLRELPKGTVAIFTLAGEDKLSAILRTADVQKAYEYPIKAADLNRKVLAFRDVVQNPHADPRPAAQELYKILVGPMAKDLRAAKAQTLMWSLDGVLRYVPLAALYDGKQYLVEQYRISVMTLASEARLKDVPDPKWTAAGFGVTQAYQDEPALPSVSSELRGIIAAKPGDPGVLSGEVKIDAEFTRDAMRETLLKRYPVVHIASHFRFEPGNETQSFLLLGNGAKLSMAELKTSANLFGGVQLLTLSACNTGVGDGTEVEGFGTLAQRQGAKAVIASLWPVMDESTSRLMQEFYRIRQSSPGMTKVDALRRSQLKLLVGSADSGGTSPHRGVSVNSRRTPQGSAGAEFQPDPSAPYAHPYYWAPFFLMGNWL
jgi:CHAT domain-containing protein/Tfp pilus assembly protein PilF